MKLSTRLTTALTALALCLCSCESDSTSTVGSSLVTDVTEIISDSIYTATGTTYSNAVVQSRTLTQLLGCLDAQEYGSFTSDFVCQFMPALNLDTAGVTAESIDSLTLVMFMHVGDFTGDSLVPMGLDVYRLTKALPSPIYSDFDPAGYYDPTPIGSRIYTAHAMHSDSLNALNFRSITVPLPVELGRELFTAFKENPNLFGNPAQFSAKFKGLYVTNSFGSGRVVNISETRLNLHYRKKTQIHVDETLVDTTENLVKSYFAVTPEVVTNNNIDLTMSTALNTMLAEGKNIIVAPTGTEIRLVFPALKLMSDYSSQAGNLSVLNSVGFSIPAKVIENDYNINPPEHVLMVLEKDKKAFFAENKITDNKTSFAGTYSAAKEAYLFPDMRQYLLDLLGRDDVKLEDYTFIITPVNIETETTSGSYYTEGSTYVTTINPYVTKPAMVELDIANCKIKLTFTRQSGS